MQPKKIPHYINDPVINRLTAPENKLYRPRISFVRAAIVVTSVITMTLCVSFLLATLFRRVQWFGLGSKSQLQAFTRVYWFVQILVFVITLRYVMIWFIRVYQRYAKSETRLRCCYTPSCSEYAILALKKYGALIGGIKAIKRLLRCGPPGGIDYP